MPAPNTYRSYDRGLNAPAADAFAITPDDNTDLPQAARAIYVGASGDMSVVTLGGTTVLFAGLGAGTTLPCSVVRVNDTDTTAANLVGLV
ncbi:MAG: hypothetical protein AcusKO_15020 [Acuticoccus sp.]